ncbi:MAG: 30S ribosome-binding factor RbfA [Saprospiraceae bacterium]|nr:30S ribosome-binding factor RbfA [Saprospiraceae bacterium]
MNESTRQKKIARLLQRELGDILQQDKRNILEGSFVTVTEVSVSPDLSVARIYLSMMLVSNKDALIERINHRKKEIRGILGNRVGKQMRIVPEIYFVVDDLQDEASKLDQIIDNLEIPPVKEDDEEETK